MADQPTPTLITSGPLNGVRSPPEVNCVSAVILERRVFITHALGVRTTKRCPNAIGDISKFCVLILAPNGPNISKAIATPAWNEMEVQMKNSLLGRFAGGCNKIHAVRSETTFDGSTNHDCCAHQLVALRSLQLPQVNNMAPRDNKSVTRCRWVERKEGNPSLVLVYDFDRSIMTLSNPTESTLVIYLR